MYESISVVKKPLILACKLAHERVTACDVRSAVRIIKYSVMFSAVMMPTNCPLWVTGKVGKPDS